MLFKLDEEQDQKKTTDSSFAERIADAVERIANELKELGILLRQGR